MKIRLAKKIMKPSFRNGKICYWHSRYDLYCMGFDGCRDHRITKAISLVERWNARRCRNESAKLNKKNPLRQIDLRHSVERCCGNCHWMGCEDILGNGWCYKKDCETSCDKVCKKHEF